MSEVRESIARAVHAIAAAAAEIALRSEAQEACGMTFDADAAPSGWRYCPGCGRPVSEHATHGAARQGEGGQQ